MYAGVGDDNFFRVNLNWFITTRKWAQFTTAAAVGAIHVGHLEDALKVLTSFLVKEAPEHVTGGAIYALGLIYVNYRWDKAILNIVTEKLESSSQKTSYDQTNKPLYVIQHGACLALGLISLGSRDTSHYNLLLKVIREDHPEPSEAAGYALGMVMLGSGSPETFDEMIRFCENTEHEKIMRGIAMGLGFFFYECGARANDTIQRMLHSRQPFMRKGAAWIIALATIGNVSNAAWQKLLNIAVSDVTDNVRRAAVIGIGFVLSRRPKEVPSMINLLAQSYHAHVRAGAALAIGISCAGTGNSEAIEVLKPLLNDNEDAVTQNAMIAMAMVLMQQSDARVPYVKEFRTFLRQMTSRRRQEMLIFGTCCAWGILNAGGRNVVISCNSLRGENSVSATVGLAMFCNHFFWHPLALMLPLSFHPTSIIGLDENLNVVNWRMRCNAPKADFDYPPDFQEESKKQMAMPVKLSISGQQTQQQQQFFDESDSDKSDEKSDEEGDKNCQIIENMSRVTLSQLPYIDIEYEKSYTPIIGHVTHGFIMLKKNTK
ncbi:Proteasome/cyclosome repeat family protein [Trichomonas vaginalis G3]|uniref:Proteasome/cyclosome repeat family protein n=2 Tax=Trichomonas vaginalis (strain ATCC PRA-98 / G3) TaxID=412133 RepID=A2FTR0_TRIV3|nr:Proteasome/cyclosome repeat family protein [Trichomonas vaginalis G3]|eukprot:XP_001304629.1 Proteasome/cyclosome repeat family protein [Trichomonas vaginalis G3]